MKHQKKRFLSILLALALALSLAAPALAADGGAALTIDPKSNAAAKKLGALAKKDWTIALYLCGTNLESGALGSSAATLDLIEMLEADIPDNVTVLVMTGGTMQWDPEDAAAEAEAEGRIAKGAYLRPDSEHTQLYRVDDDKMTLLYTYDANLDMGDVATAAEFMEFALAYAPAERFMFQFWDHGGGPISGAEQDEYSENILPLADIAAVIAAGADARGKKLDVVGFDCCLMGNLETAYALAPSADYLVASEEIEPGTGWFYHWLSIFSEEKNVTPVMAGKRIVDLYPMDQEWAETTDLTLALFDLSKIPALAKAVDALAAELVAALDDPETYALIARAAEDTPSMSNGSWGLGDLYVLAAGLEPILPSAKGVLDALGKKPDALVGEAAGDGAVMYRGVSANYTDCLGLSIYYPVVETPLGDEDELAANLETYRAIGMSERYADYIDAITLETDQLQTFEGEMVVAVDGESGLYYMYVADPADLVSLKKVEVVAKYVHIAPDGTETTYQLGAVDAAEDWENNVFVNTFGSSWAAINGEPFTYDIEDGDMVRTYAIPIVVEGSDHISILTALESPESPGYLILASVVEVTGEAYAARSWSPAEKETFTFSTLLLQEDDDKALWDRGYLKNTPITLTQDDLDPDEGSFVLELEEARLSGGTDKAYDSYFLAYDMKGNVYRSAPMRQYLINDISELSIDPIPDQIYTGAAVEPYPTVRFAGSEILLDSQFTVSYENNVEKGTATLILDFDDDEGVASGTLTADFAIRDVNEIFSDVTSDAWYLGELGYVYSNGLMGATDAHTFAPGTGTTRGMLATVLYRLAGTPAAAESADFTDVAEGAWYADAVAWAANTGITEGRGDGTFGPTDPLTRQDCATMLYRYAQTLGEGFEGAWAFLLDYPDADQISDYADEAMHWMVMEGVLTGMDDGTLAPWGGATRAQFAAMISRFIAAVEEA